MLSTRNIRPRPARLIDSDGKTYVGTFSHTDYGVHVTFDRTADVGFSDNRHFYVEGNQVYRIKFDLSFKEYTELYVSDEMETNFSEVRAKAKGNCQGQLPKP